MYKIVYTKQAIKDIPRLKSVNLDKKVLSLIEILQKDPFQNPPPYEKLIGNFQGLFSRRINIKHRLVYKLIEDNRIVKIISMWTHYENL